MKTNQKMHLKTKQPKPKLRAKVSFHSRAPSRPGWSTRTPSRRHASSTTGASPIGHGRPDQKGGGAAQGPSLTSSNPGGLVLLGKILAGEVCRQPPPSSQPRALLNEPSGGPVSSGQNQKQVRLFILPPGGGGYSRNS